MIILDTIFRDLKVIEPKIFEDSRGYFFESYNEKVFEENGLKYDWVQENESMSNKGVLRGLHYQLSPFAQTKLVRVVRGSVIDIVVDIRKSSPTFGKIFSIELTAQNKKQLLVPKGFAHGFVVLEDNTIFSYKCDELYNKECERGINPFDEYLSIDWGISKDLAILSEKDLNSPSFTNAEYNFSF